MTPSFMNVLAATMAGSLLAACAGTTPASAPMPTPPAGAAREAAAILAPASGSLVSGKLVLRSRGDGVHISGDIGGFKPGDVRGFHIHEKGDCSAADASSAGGHFNPGAQPHGRVGQGAHHAGDNDNIVADMRGIAHVDAHVAGVTLGGGTASDIAGRAIIVHAQADDYATQPTGNAGARVACGVIRAVR